MVNSKKTSRILPIATIIFSSSFAGAQQPYPNKPVHIIAPYTPGASTDVMARMAGQKLAEKWGHQIVVENRGGGNTLIGTGAVAKAPADGYTYLWIATAFVTTPSLLSYLPYDPIKDFDGVATFATTRNFLVLHPSVPVNTVQELIALAKSKPGQLNYASSGVGTGPHMSMELFSMVAGVKMAHIPYKGTSQSVIDLIAGRVQLAFAGASSVIPHIKSGKLKAVAIGSENRSPALPQVPTFGEAGLPAYNRKDSWHGIVAPAGTPGAIIDKLSNEITKVLVMPDIQEYLTKQGMEGFISTPSQTTALIKADIATYSKIVKFANIKIDD